MANRIALTTARMRPMVARSRGAWCAVQVIQHSTRLDASEAPADRSSFVAMTEVELVAAPRGCTGCEKKDSLVGMSFRLSRDGIAAPMPASSLRSGQAR